jgi:C_GCAxxG_C_C family probable redox protein
VNRVETAVELFRKGCACSQAILVVYGEPYGLDPKLAMKLSAGFVAGMGMAETCGAVTGAYMVLGLYACGDKCNTNRGRKKVTSLMRKFTTRFKEKNSSICCRELLNCDIETPAGMKKAKAEHLFETRCAKMVHDAADILEDMLGLDGK